MSRYHREFGGDLICEIGSGYFGLRIDDGSFSDQRFVENATSEQVRMIAQFIAPGGLVADRYEQNISETYWPGARADSFAPALA